MCKPATEANEEAEQSSWKGKRLRLILSCFLSAVLGVILALALSAGIFDHENEHYWAVRHYFTPVFVLMLMLAALLRPKADLQDHLTKAERFLANLFGIVAFGCIAVLVHAALLLRGGPFRSSLKEFRFSEFFSNPWVFWPFVFWTFFLVLRDYVDRCGKLRYAERLRRERGEGKKKNEAAPAGE